MRRGVFALTILTLALALQTSSGANISFHVSVQDGTVHPGEETVLAVILENEATLSNFPINENTSALLPLLTTARNLRVELDDSRAPFTVESPNPAIIGDLPSGIVSKVSFRIKVDENAESGTYSVPLRMSYSKIAYYLFNGNPVINYEDESSVEYLKITLKRKDYDVKLIPVRSTLNAGEKGTVQVRVENTGEKTLKNCVVVINTTPPLRPDPVALTSFLGDLNPGEKRNVTFRLYVMSGALNQTYPATIILRFETETGLPMSIVKTVGLRVSDSKAFRLRDVRGFLTSYRQVSSSTGVQSVRGYVSAFIENLGDDVAAYAKYGCGDTFSEWRGAPKKNEIPLTQKGPFSGMTPRLS